MKRFLLSLLLLPFLALAQSPNQQAKSITVRITFSGAVTSASTSFTPLKYNKSLWFGYGLDDRSPNMRDVVPYFGGGVAAIDGVTYSARTFTDGCGHAVKWTGYVAANARLNGDNSDWINYNNCVSWTEMAGYINQGWAVQNHGYYHNSTGTFTFGTNWAENIRAAHNYIYDSLAAHGVSYIPRIFVVPNADQAHLLQADLQGYIGGTTQANDPGGYTSYPAFPEGSLFINSVPYQRFTDWNRSYKDGWTAADRDYFEGVILNNFVTGATPTNPKGWSIFGHYFANTTEWGFFKQTMDYLQIQAGDNLWASSLHELAEYREVINNAIKVESFKNGVLTVVINYAKIPDVNRYRDVSMLVNHSGGTIVSVQEVGTNSDGITFNTSTGLINITSRKTTGFVDPIKNVNPGGIRRVVLAAVSDTGAYYPNATSNFNPGDTIVLGSQYYSYIYFKNLRGTPAKPIVILNGTGVVEYSHDIKLDSCAYVHVTGTGDPTKYWGIRCTGEKYTPGEALSVKSLSHNIEIDHIEVRNKTYAFLMKNEASPDMLCDASLYWPAHFDSVDVHHLWGHNILQDWSYFGSSDPYNKARPITCAGVQTFPRPTGLKNVWFHSNILDTAARSGVQWGGSDAGVNMIYDNLIRNMGSELNVQQGAGVAVGSATTNITVFRNQIVKTFKPGLFSYHYGQGTFTENFVDSSGYVWNGTQTGQSSFIMNTFDAENPLPTLFTIRDNTFGVNTSTNTPQRVIEFINTQNNYGTPNFICGNVWMGLALDATNIYKENNGVTWTTNCAGLLANAGSDQVITVLTVNLSGSATAAGGHTITGYNWQKISGPGATSIPNPNNQNVTATGLQIGVYVFRLTVTQDDATTATDDVQVTVNPSPTPPGHILPTRRGRRIRLMHYF